jgi:hypothetical protein
VNLFHQRYAETKKASQLDEELDEDMDEELDYDDEME